ncbi:glycosyltransferase family 8 protein [Lentisphaerota bacterium ZTH]|nr:glycosyltransferase family 8 protein [Lentisphaerota bacterium]WET06316.1 glycosyltransferase family 8 protein [Lentisphaerota bacterium ZTH]
MSDDTINVCLSTDRNYVQHAGATIASILKKAAAEDKLVFYILHDCLTREDKNLFLQLQKIKDCRFEFVVPPEIPDFNLHDHPYISKACFYRLLLPELLPDVDRIIYVDCDVVAFSSLRELWLTDMKDHCFAGVGDSMSNINEHCRKIGFKSSIYVNSGILLMDLKKAREINLTRELFKVADEIHDRATLHDQDIINVTLQGNILILPLKWNLSTGFYKRKYDVQYYSDAEIKEAAKHPCLVHISGKRKPWSWRCCRNPYWFEYFKALRGTPWSHNYYKGLIKKLIFPSRRMGGPAAKR